MYFQYNLKTLKYQLLKSKKYTVPLNVLKSIVLLLYILEKGLLIYLFIEATTHVEIETKLKELKK